MPRSLRWILLLVAFGLLPVGCTAENGGPSNPEDWEPTKDKSGKPQQPAGEADALYGVLDQYFADVMKGAKAKGRSTVLLASDTVPVTKHKSMTFPQDYAGIHRYLETVPKACADAFGKANKQRFRLPAKPEPPKVVELVGLMHINALFHNGGWAAVHKEHPKAFALVSAARPGLCQHHGEALVYFNETRGDGSLAALLVHAKHEDKGWRIVKKAVIAAEDGEET